MAETKFAVPCRCGKNVVAKATDAGAKLPCACGLLVEIPSLSKMRSALGSAGATPEFTLTTLLARKLLPQEHDCAICECETSDCFWVQVRCEAPTAKPRMSLVEVILLVLLWPLFIGKIFIFFSSQGAGEAQGRDVSFTLPIRLCSECTSELESWDVVKEAMCRTPVYADLLEKHPGSQMAKVNSTELRL